MLILPLFATYLETLNGQPMNSQPYATERFHNEYNNEYDRNGNLVELNVEKYDIISALYLLMRGYNANYYYRWGIMDYICVALLYILTFIISVFAAYLSYSCTWKGIVSNIVARLLFAFAAFMLGPFYLLWYFFVNYLGSMC
jgi:hypothetical protein